MSVTLSLAPLNEIRNSQRNDVVVAILRFPQSQPITKFFVLVHELRLTNDLQLLLSKIAKKLLQSVTSK